MRRFTSKVHVPVLLVLLAVVLGTSGGCNPLEFFNGNLGLNIILPLGLSGNVGVLNPDGGDISSIFPVITGN
jgi:hypothetical protein